MRLLSVDPSSTRTGFAAFDEHGRLSASGTIRPKGADAWERIEATCDRLWDLVEETGPHGVAVVEVSGGKVHRGVRGQSGGAGLATYGEACGAVCLTLCRAVGFDRLRRIAAYDWTRGRSKSARREALALLIPSYDPDNDPGADEADAIELGLWWLDKQRLEACS